MQISPLTENAENSNQFWVLRGFQISAGLSTALLSCSLLRPLKILCTKSLSIFHTPTCKASTPKNQPRGEFKQKKPPKTNKKKNPNQYFLGCYHDYGTFSYVMKRWKLDSAYLKLSLQHVEVVLPPAGCSAFPHLRCAGTNGYGHKAKLIQLMFMFELILKSQLSQNLLVLPHTCL